MANNLFVSYDLHAPGKNYEAVIGAIKQFGTYAKVHYSFWHLRTNLTAEQVAKFVWQFMDSNDSLIVVDATNDHAYWYNLDPAVSKHLQENWRSHANV